MNVFSVQEVYFYLPDFVQVALYSSGQFQPLLIRGLLVERQILHSRTKSTDFHSFVAFVDLGSCSQRQQP